MNKAPSEQLVEINLLLTEVKAKYAVEEPIDREDYFTRAFDRDGRITKETLKPFFQWFMRYRIQGPERREFINLSEKLVVFSEDISLEYAFRLTEKLKRIDPVRKAANS